MKITDEQLELLNTLKCVRLSSDTSNHAVIDSFKNTRNPNLVDKLKESAWSEDKEGSTAYYFVKTKEGYPLIFFSLKCGSLITNFDPQKVEDSKKKLFQLLGILKDPKTDADNKLRNAVIRNYVDGTGQTESDLINFIKGKLDYKKFFLDSLNEDMSQDTNSHTVRVHHTHSGIELVHICSNDTYKGIWKSFKLQQPLGKIVFWHFIVPILMNVKENVGCKYVFLFAADDSADGSLINYYKESLGFNVPNDIGTSKPFYDYNCTFMCKEINVIEQECQKFYNDFNLDPSEQIV